MLIYLKDNDIIINTDQIAKVYRQHDDQYDDSLFLDLDVDQPLPTNTDYQECTIIELKDNSKIKIEETLEQIWEILSSDRD